MARIQRNPVPIAEIDTPQAAGSIMGHNAPPPEEMAREDFNRSLDAALARRGLTRERFDELVDQSTRAVAIDDESVGRCGELVKSLRAAVKLIDEVHQEVKAPFLAAGRELDGMRNTLKDPLDRAKRAVEAKQGNYLREQEAIRQAEARRQREAEEAARRELAERLAAERAAAADAEAPDFSQVEEYIAAPPPPPKAEPIRGDFGAAVSGQKVWTHEITDITVAFIAVADNAKVREAIDKAIGGMVRNGARQIEGVRIFQTLKASNR